MHTAHHHHHFHFRDQREEISTIMILTGGLLLLLLAGAYTVTQSFALNVDAVSLGVGSIVMILFSLFMWSGLAFIIAGALAMIMVALAAPFFPHHPRKSLPKAA